MVMGHVGLSARIPKASIVKEWPKAVPSHVSSYDGEFVSDV